MPAETLTDILLTAKQQLFVDAYFACNFNATRAAIRAGYSKKTAYSIGSENLRKPDVSAAIKKRMSECVMGADEALARLSAQARVDMADFLDIPVPDEELSPADKAKRDADAQLARMYPSAKVAAPDPMEARLNLTKADRAGLTNLVKSFEPTEFGTKITLVDSRAALDMILRVNGAYREQQQSAEALDLLRAVLIGELDEEDDAEGSSDTEGVNGDEA